jgi:hypothetical protein
VKCEMLEDCETLTFDYIHVQQSSEVSVCSGTEAPLW